MTRGEPAAGFILAGGASRRMGSDKALLRVQDATLLERMVRIAAGSVQPVSVVAPAGKYEHFGFPVIPDLWPGEGPLGGILTALHHSSASLNLILAVDLISVSTGLLDSLLNRAAASSRTAVPIFAGGRAQPLCAVYQKACLPALQAAFDAGGRRVMDAIQSIPLEPYPLPNERFLNLNTPEEWEAVRQ